MRRENMLTRRQSQRPSAVGREHPHGNSALDDQADGTLSLLPPLHPAVSAANTKSVAPLSAARSVSTLLAARPPSRPPREILPLHRTEELCSLFRKGWCCKEVATQNIRAVQHRRLLGVAGRDCSLRAVSS